MCRAVGDVRADRVTEVLLLISDPVLFIVSRARQVGEESICIPWRKPARPSPASL
jgi:hypothetical protein